MVEEALGCSGGWFFCLGPRLLQEDQLEVVEAMERGRVGGVGGCEVEVSGYGDGSQWW